MVRGHYPALTGSNTPTSEVGESKEVREGGDELPVNA